MRRFEIVQLQGRIIQNLTAKDHAIVLLRGALLSSYKFKRQVFRPFDFNNRDIISGTGSLLENGSDCDNSAFVFHVVEPFVDTLAQNVGGARYFPSHIGHCRFDFLQRFDNRRVLFVFRKRRLLRHLSERFTNVLVDLFPCRLKRLSDVVNFRLQLICRNDGGIVKPQRGFGVLRDIRVGRIVLFGIVLLLGLFFARLDFVLRFRLAFIQEIGIESGIVVKTVLFCLRLFVFRRFVLFRGLVGFLFRFDVICRNVVRWLIIVHRNAGIRFTREHPHQIFGEILGNMLIRLGNSRQRNRDRGFPFD